MAQVSGFNLNVLNSIPNYLWTCRIDATNVLTERFPVATANFKAYEGVMQVLPWCFKQQVRWMEDRGASSDAVLAMINEMLRNRDKFFRESEVRDVSKNASTHTAAHDPGVPVLSESL